MFDHLLHSSSIHYLCSVINPTNKWCEIHSPSLRLRLLEVLESGFIPQIHSCVVSKESTTVNSSFQELPQLKQRSLNNCSKALVLASPCTGRPPPLQIINNSYSADFFLGWEDCQVWGPEAENRNYWVFVAPEWSTNIKLHSLTDRQMDGQTERKTRRFRGAVFYSQLDILIISTKVT